MDANIANALDKSVAGDTIQGVVKFSGIGSILANTDGAITTSVTGAILVLSTGGIQSDDGSGIQSLEPTGIVPVVAGGITDGGVVGGIQATVAGGIKSTVAGGIQSAVAGGITDGGTASGIEATVADGITTSVVGGISVQSGGSLTLKAGSAAAIAGAVELSSGASLSLAAGASFGTAGDVLIEASSETTVECVPDFTAGIQTGGPTVNNSVTANATISGGSGTLTLSAPQYGVGLIRVTRSAPITGTLLIKFPNYPTVPDGTTWLLDTSACMVGGTDTGSISVQVGTLETGLVYNGSYLYKNLFMVQVNSASSVTVSG
jgi:hypothetical protein